MKKVGIITHYYKNLNYGGSLQAYALCRVLREMGFDAEQISYDMHFPPIPYAPVLRLKKVIKTAILGIRYLPWSFGWRKRKKSFYNFQEQIPHSVKIYNKDTIAEAKSCYDVFITGSDQVWNTQWYHSAFFLDFVSGDKKKIAYAASLGQTQLDEKSCGIFTRSLKDFNAVSVRELDAVDMISQYTSVPVVQTLDPTMLLSAQQWDEICSDPIVEGKYIFCFLLGDGQPERQAVRRFANEIGVKIVTLPHFPCSYRKNDQNFADIFLYDISPMQFISLIKYAEYVFTDSFHAAVFSNIYKKDYFVFERNNGKNMRSRIVSLLSFYNCEHRFLDRPEKLEFAYMQNAEKTNFTKVRDDLEEKRNASLAFLRNHMVDTE